MIALCFLVNNSCAGKYSDGEFMYKKVCANCHMDDGSGLVGLIPPLADADYLTNNLSNLPCIIRHGLSGPITVNGRQYAGQDMAGIPVLTEVDITNIWNFMNTKFNYSNKEVSLQEVRKILENCPK